MSDPLTRCPRCQGTLIASPDPDRRDAVITWCIACGYYRDSTTKEVKPVMLPEKPKPTVAPKPAPTAAMPDTAVADYALAAQTYLDTRRRHAETEILLHDLATQVEAARADLDAKHLALDERLGLVPPVLPALPESEPEAETRPRGKGSVYQRPDGKWTTAATIGYKPNGQQIRCYAYGKTREAAEERLAEKLGESVPTEQAPTTDAPKPKQKRPMTPARWAVIQKMQAAKAAKRAAQNGVAVSA